MIHCPNIYSIILREYFPWPKVTSLTHTHSSFFQTCQLLRFLTDSTPKDVAAIGQSLDTTVAGCKFKRISWSDAQLCLFSALAKTLSTWSYLYYVHAFKVGTSYRDYTRQIHYTVRRSVLTALKVKLAYFLSKLCKPIHHAPVGVRIFTFAKTVFLAKKIIYIGFNRKKSTVYRPCATRH